jgi:predicted DCC family thiol-disulfide oxidoreductase YuxK
MQPDPNTPILLFDGECNLCDASVQFVLDNDHHKRIKFAAQQSAAGQALLQAVGRNPASLDTMVLLYRGKVWTESAAALETARLMGGSWTWLGNLGLLFPGFVRNPVYRLVARNRLKWFGKRATCRMATPEERDRFLV